MSWWGEMSAVAVGIVVGLAGIVGMLVAIDRLRDYLKRARQARLNEQRREAAFTRFRQRAGERAWRS